MNELAIKQYSFLEYLEFEENSEEKHEYHDGYVWAMAGGTPNHSTISVNISASLSSVLRGKQNGCRPFNNDLKVFIEDFNRGVYPDAMVICGKPELYLNKKDVVVNPVLIIEVLSKSTAAFDRGDKFRFYRSLPSFKEYILIDQYQPVVEGYYWEDKKDNLWRISNATGLDKSIPIYSIDAQVALKDIYAFIEFSGDAQTKMDF